MIVTFNVSAHEVITQSHELSTLFNRVPLPTTLMLLACIIDLCNDNAKWHISSTL